MEKVDFSPYAQPVPPVDVFGLVDPDDKMGKKPVYIDLENRDIWGATVHYNRNIAEYKFIPVDNNVPLKRDDGSDISRCDAIITTANSVCFIELKNQRRASIPKATRQLISTINIFKDIEKYQKKVAYICNRKKGTVTAISYKEDMNRFMKEIGGVTLRISDEIKGLT